MPDAGFSQLNLVIPAGLSYVTALDKLDGSLFVGGGIIVVQGTSAPGIAKLDPVTGDLLD